MTSPDPPVPDQSANQPPSPPPMAGPPPMRSTTPATAGPQYGSTAVASAGRPALATGAAITMIVVGALFVIFGLIALLAGVFVGGAASQVNVQAPGFGGLAGAVAGVIIVLAVIFFGIGILDIVAGANVLGGRSWARITGIVVAAIMAVFGVLSLGSLSANHSNPILSILLLVANLYIVWGLATTGSWFAGRSR